MEIDAYIFGNTLGNRLFFYVCISDVKKKKAWKNYTIDPVSLKVSNVEINQ